MASAQYTGSYNFNPVSPTGSANWLSDVMLGTDTVNNAYQWASQNEQNRFTEYMDSTQYQRAVQDMLAAGVNPMIAFSGGAGSAKDSGGSSSSGSRSNFNRSGGILGSMLGSAVKSFGQSIGVGSGAGAAKLLGSLLK